jgi:hypothetical protein
MYVDPAAGSLILQVLAAGLLAATASVKSAREAAKRFLLKLFSRKER